MRLASPPWLMSIPFLLFMLFALGSCAILQTTPAPEPVGNSHLTLTESARTINSRLTQAAEELTPAPEGLNLPTATPSPSRTPLPDPSPGASLPAPSLTLVPGETTGPTPTGASTSQATPTMEFVYQDNFEVTQGWYTFDGERFRMEYKDGTYHIFNNMLNAAVNSVRTQNYEDVHIEVDASRALGPPNAYFGLVCRFQDDSNYYALVLGSDGFYGIARLRGGEISFISRPPSPSEAIEAGFSVNRVGATCKGDTLTLYSNGVKLTEVQDSSFTSGYIGLVVGTTSVAGVEVKFDNFRVFRSPTNGGAE